MIEVRNYSYDYYQKIMSGSTTSANVVVPIIMNTIGPTSVIDVGCGTGTWLSVFQKYGVNVLGIDKFSADKKLFQIDEEFFKEVDLEQEIDLNQKFDLAVSLEVAEHLTETRGNSFARDLTKLSKVVLFSAAIPAQGGMNHINERWQSYWVEQFAQCSYKAIDYIRPRIWMSANVEWWYRQNIILFCAEDSIEKFPKIIEYCTVMQENQAWDLVHPELYKSKAVQTY